MRKHDESNTNVTALEAPIATATLALNAEAATNVDKIMEQKKRQLATEIKRLQQEQGNLKKEKEETIKIQEDAYTKLEPTLNKLSAYKGKKAIVDYKNKSFHISGYESSDWTKSQDLTIKHLSRLSDEETNKNIEGLILLLEKKQKERLSSYLTESRKQTIYSDRANDPFALLKELLRFTEINAFAICLNDEIYPISKEEIQECCSLKSTIDAYKQGACISFALGGGSTFFGSLVLFCAMLGLFESKWTIPSISSMIIPGLLVAGIFITAGIAGLIAGGVCTHLPIRIKHTSPKNLSIWRESQAKEQPGEANSHTKVESPV